MVPKDKDEDEDEEDKHIAKLVGYLVNKETGGTLSKNIYKAYQSYGLDYRYINLGQW